MKFIPDILVQRYLAFISVLIATPAAGQGMVPVGPAVGSTEILNVGTGLAAVIATIVVVGFLYTRSKRMLAKGDDVINIVAVQTLGPRERILLVEVASKQLVLGMTASQVQTLHVFDEPVIEPGRDKAPFSFASRLRLAMRGTRK